MKRIMRGLLLLAAAIALSGPAHAQGRPDEPTKPPEKNEPETQPADPGQGITPRGETGEEEEGAGEANGPRQRRRQSIVYQPPLEAEQQFACTLNGTLEAMLLGERIVDGGADIVQRVVGIDPDGTVRLSTRMLNGKCLIGKKEKKVGDDNELIATFDARHQMLQVQRVTTESDEEDDNSLDLGTIVLYLLTSVAYHERTVREGTTWQTEYRTTDANGKSLRMAGRHELLAFVPEGERLVGVIQSKVQIPVSGRTGDFDLVGALDCDVLSEVYVNTGEIRYRRAISTGKLKGALVTLKVPRLETILKLRGPDGALLDSLYDKLGPAEGGGAA